MFWEKKMRRGLLYAAALGMVLALMGCGGKMESEQETEKTKEQLQEEVTGNEEITGDEDVVSYLTGLPVSEEVKQSRPLAVMFNNIKEGCPQAGIAEAAIVYEVPVEGRITRLMGIFDDYRNLEKVGSIRSSRDYFVYFAMEYDSLYAHFGQATPYVGDLLNSDRVDNLSGAVAGIDKPATKTFYRSNDRKAPHNVYLSSEGIEKDIKKFGYRTELKEDYTAKFQFESESTPISLEYAEDASMIYPGGKTADKKNGFSKVEARFEYNEEDDLYYRYQYGEEHIDELTGEQLAYSNVIFQYCHGEVRDKQDYLAFGCHGDEKRMIRVFTQGKMIPGVWVRESDDVPAMYTDYNGDPIVLSPGKTWICIIWDEYRDDVVYE